MKYGEPIRCQKSAGEGEQATIGLVVSGFTHDWTSMATVKDLILFLLGLHEKSTKYVIKYSFLSLKADYFAVEEVTSPLAFGDSFQFFAKSSSLLHSVPCP